MWYEENVGLAVQPRDSMLLCANPLKNVCSVPQKLCLKHQSLIFLPHTHAKTIKTKRKAGAKTVFRVRYQQMLSAFFFPFNVL